MKYKGKSHDGQTLGDRCKEYEESTEQRINKEDYIVIRLDGHGFSKYTKKFIRPFDSTFSKAMQKVTIELCKEFGAISGYTQSDEITLILSPAHGKVKGVDVNTQIYAGRVTKLASLTAGFATAVFNQLMINYSNKIGWFDSRVYGVKTKEEATNSIIWRSRDAIKNSKGMFAHAYCSHKSLLNLNSQEQIDFCKETTGNDWELAPEASKFGTLVKKTSVLKYSDYLKEEIMRKEYITLTVPMNTFSEDLVDLLTCIQLKEKECQK